MSARKLRSYLADFDVLEGIPTVPADTGYSQLLEAPDKSGKAQARQEGFEAGLAQARSENENAAEIWVQRGIAERRRWVETESQQLAVQIGRAFSDITAKLAEQMAQVLRPVIFDAIRTRALDSMAQDIRALLADPAAAALQISGPADLLAGLSARLKELPLHSQFRPSAQADAVAVLKDTQIETRLETWRARLQLDTEQA